MKILSTPFQRLSACLLALSISTAAVRAADTTVTAVPRSTGRPDPNPLYTENRDPLLPSAFIKLPIGAITPRGWLLRQLELERDGMTGHLEEISKWCKFDGNAWTSPDGQGENGWEEVPYWLKGYGDLGYVLKDQKIIAEARRWIDAVLASQEPDGFFGPRANKTGLEGHPDLWPHMVMLNVLQSFYEYSHDPRVVPFITRYLHWLNTLPGDAFGRGYWPKIRFGDTIETAYWLYNLTGDASLLELATKIHKNMEDWTSGVHNWHNVNVSQGFREPGVYYTQAKDIKFLDAAENNYETVMRLYGQFPGGGFAGDENCRNGYTDPHQGFETCGMVEFMHSFEMLTKVSGEPIWADRCEEIAFNSLPAALTPDWRGLHYLTCANQVQLDKSNHRPGIDNGGMMFAYSPFEEYRCCQHNVSHGWPYYAEELWLATTDHGLCASLYAASKVTAQVANGDKIEISETTEYPFDSTVTLRLATPGATQFPLYLRIPKWCASPKIKVNGKSLRTPTDAPCYIVINRQWKDGDVVTLQLPMEVTVKRWEANRNAASISYGPLEFSLKINENWKRDGGTPAWPEYDVLPGSAWNYGLALPDRMPEHAIKVVKKKSPLPDDPFTQQSTPIELKVRAERIPSWKIDKDGLVGRVPESPAQGEGSPENVTLIPLGAARLRISMFPVVH